MRFVTIPLIVLLVVSVIPFALGETPWLEDYSYRKLITVAGSTGAETDYVVFVKAYYASGTDGSEVLTGGHNGVTASKVYLAGHVETDFDDVRFAETDGLTELDYFRDSYTASTSALFAVEVSGNLSVTQSFYIYFGDAGQATESNAANTFRRVISTGVVLALPINEGTDSTLTDYSANGLNFTNYGNPSWITTGKFGNALRLDGAGDGSSRVENNVYDLTGALSICGWVNNDEDADTNGIFQKYNAYMFWRHGNNRLGFRRWTGAAAAAVYSSSDVGTGWVHHAVTFDSATGAYVFYKNGIADGSGNMAVGAIDSVDELPTLGRNSWSGTDLDGDMNGVFLFNYVLTQPEVTDLNAYYAQCSTANTGSLYLRSFVNPEPQPSSVGSLEVNNRYASTNYVWMAVLLVIGFVFMGFMLMRREN